MESRSGVESSAPGTVEVAAIGTVPQVRPRSTEVGVMQPAVEGTAEEEMGMVVEGMGLVEEETGAVAEEMVMVEGVKVEEETAGVVAATAARTSCI